MEYPYITFTFHLFLNHIGNYGVKLCVSVACKLTRQIIIVKTFPFLTMFFGHNYLA